MTITEPDTYKLLVEADQQLTRAIQNQEGQCRIAYWESVVEERRRDHERNEQHLNGCGETENLSRNSNAS